MPNWVHNTLDVTGGEDEVNRFCRSLPDFDESGFIPHLIPAAPYSEDETMETEKGVWYVLTADRYDWCLENWGVKWGDCHTALADVAPGRATLTFDTAWGVAQEGLETISKMFPTLCFVVHSIEEQPAFRCRMITENGSSITEFDDIFEGPSALNVPDSVEDGYWWNLHDNLHQTVLPVGGDREWELSVHGCHRVAMENA